AAGEAVAASGEGTGLRVEKDRDGARGAGGVVERAGSIARRPGGQDRSSSATDNPARAELVRAVGRAPGKLPRQTCVIAAGSSWGGATASRGGRAGATGQS